MIVLSAWGCNLGAVFARGRLVQELGREGILPWSSFFASDWPFHTPLAGSFVQWVVSSTYVLLSPPGDAYLFILTRTWALLIPARFGSRELINGLSFSDILPPLFDQYIHLGGAPVHPFAPEGDVGAGVEPTVSGVHGGGLAFLRIECVLDHRSIHPTCPRLRGLRTHTVLRGWDLQPTI